MKKNMKIVAALMAIGLISPMAYATNGDHMMSVGAQNTALGGTGVANFSGAESVWANPAMLGKSKGSEVVGGIVLFMPDVTNTGMGGTAATSDADTNYIPDVSYSSRINDKMTYGIAMAGIAGMGVDYSTAPATHIMAETALSIARVSATFAYNEADYGVGISPVMQYGSLMITYGGYNAAKDADTDTAFGYALGGYYNVSPAVTVAASYQSAIEMSYGTQLSGAAAGFGLMTGSPFGEGFADKLEQPAEMKAGVAYTTGAYTLTADYKTIAWSSAAGYKDYNWEDQNVMAVGVKYAGNGFWVGAGYNSASDPIKDTGGATYRASVINFFNNMMFPAVVEDSMTFGGGYEMSKAMTIEGAVTITPEVTKTVDVSAVMMAGGAPAGTYTNTTTHSQSAYTVSLRYKF